MNFAIRTFRDTRTIDLLERGRAIAQEQADQQLQAEFDRRVRENMARRAAEGRYHPAEVLRIAADAA